MYYIWVFYILNINQLPFGGMFSRCNTRCTEVGYRMRIPGTFCKGKFTLVKPQSKPDSITIFNICYEIFMLKQTYYVVCRQNIISQRSLFQDPDQLLLNDKFLEHSELRPFIGLISINVLINYWFYIMVLY